MNFVSNFFFVIGILSYSPTVVSDVGCSSLRLHVICGKTVADDTDGGFAACTARIIRGLSYCVFGRGVYLKLFILFRFILQQCCNIPKFS